MKKIQRAKLFTILLLGWMIPCVCFSQQYVFKNFDTQQGLPSSEVYNCFQDAKGKIWFLTDSGLSMYDGYSFQNFSTKDGLLDNTLLNYSKVSDSLVWISSLNNQLVALNTNDVSFEPYKFNHKIKDVLLKSKLRNANFNSFSVKPNHELFASLTLFGKVQIDAKGITNEVLNPISLNGSYTHHYTTPKGEIKMYKGKINDTLLVKNHSYIRIKSEKSTRYNSLRLNKQLTIISDDNELFLYKNGVLFIKKNSENQVLNIGKFYNNQFWVSYIGNGVDIFDENGVLQDHFLDQKSVTSLLIDHKQSFWATTLNSGVYYCKNPALTFYEISESNHVHDMVRKNDTLFLSTYDGIIFKYHQQLFTVIHKAFENRPIAIAIHRNTNDLVFNSRGIYSFNEKKLILNSYARGFSDSETDSLYSYGSIPLAHQYVDGKITTKEIIQSDVLKTRVTLDIQPYKDKLLFATNNELFSSPKDNIVLFEGRVNDVDRFQDDFAIATSEKGVVLFKDEQPFLTISTADGLYSNQISELLVENDSVIWAGSNFGVNRIEIVNDAIANISGLSHTENLGIEVNDVEIVNDTLWIATKKGLYSHPTANIKSKTNETPRFFTLEEISVNGEKRAKQGLTQLSHNENAIFIRYNYILFDNMKTVEYRYQFEDDDWVYTKNREIRLNNVPAIHKNFIIQARELSGIWTDRNQLIIPIHITPAFWTTWWFKSLLVGAFGVLIYFFFKIRVFTYNKDIIRSLLMSLFNRVKTEKLAITIKSDGKHIKLFSSDLLYIQSSGNYIEIFTKEKSHVTRGTIKSFQKELPDKINYLQIHRSYLVRLDKINAHNYTSVTINELSIPIGKTYQKEVNKILLK
ncbi:LytTR family transcriptional regulator DNA-binding domain-containing protein [Kordia sp. YSTF-M3]|uniref:LytTR family transcriptional regulator DNA-binding domain-containing protein n=1 Tax=Kordia aestuariivivens TaxID=2759037 RepID=A0ABR7Q764_9FLAO|nr:LytTR family DNA-binding domain-containing protein [Kordia aestuariivivens]MBC8754411.1 LytTR family transcriptional regulator DNA-binding domain-containing protein [Kordia aestuariivivens]